MARQLILDVDTGTDDAVAMMMAALHPDLDLLGCTTVFGNLDVSHTTDNTLRVLDHIARPDVGTYRGLGSPMGKQIPPEAEVNRSKGSIHPDTLPLPTAISSARNTPAVEWLVETLRATTEQITIVPVGPLTNIAAAVTAAPEVVRSVDEIVIMGGGHEIGNVTPSAEANIWHDPVAADLVLHAGFQRLVLVPLDATHQAYVSDAQCRDLEETGTPAATAAATLIAHRIAGYDTTQPMARPRTAPVHDALCVAYLVQPELIGLHHYHVAVETTGLLTSGRTVVDTHRRGYGTPNAHVAMSANSQLFFDLMRATLSRTANHSVSTPVDSTL